MVCWPEDHDVEALIVSHCTAQSVLRLASVNRRWRDRFDERLRRARAMWRWLQRPTDRNIVTRRPDWVAPGLMARWIDGADILGWAERGLAIVDPLKGAKLILRARRRIRVVDGIANVEQLQQQLGMAGVPPFARPRIQAEVLVWLQGMEKGRLWKQGSAHFWKSNPSCWEFERDFFRPGGLPVYDTVYGVLRFQLDGTMELSYLCVCTDGPLAQRVYGHSVGMAPTIESLESFCACRVPEWTDRWALASTSTRQVHVVVIDRM